MIVFSLWAVFNPLGVDERTAIEVTKLLPPPERISHHIALLNMPVRYHRIV